MIDVSAIFDEAVMAEESIREPDGKWHPSSMWGCPREAVLGVRGVPPERKMDVDSLRRFWLGHTIHAFAQDAIGKRVETFYPEFTIDWPELNIVGAGDGLIQLKDKTWVVLEIKSIRKAGLKKTPLAHHIAQASVYAVAAHDVGVWVPAEVPYYVAPLGDTLKGVVLWYFEKEDGTSAQYFIPYAEAWRKQIIDRVLMLEAYREGKLPQCLSQQPGEKWREKYCSYFPMCRMTSGEALAHITQEEDLF